MIENKKKKSSALIFIAEIIVGVALYMLCVEYLWPMITG